MNGQVLSSQMRGSSVAYVSGMHRYPPAYLDWISSRSH